MSVRSATGHGRKCTRLPAVGKFKFCEAALVYARCGLRVLPLRPGEKIPLAALVRHGVHQATDEPAVIRSWWTQEPDANVGVACLEMLVVDVDVRRRGDEQLARLIDTHGPLPATPIQRTATGGTHILFRAPAVGLRGKLTSGIDLLTGPGRYFVAAPSVRQGCQYRWEIPRWEARLADAPDWLVGLARRPDAAPPPLMPVLDGEVRIERARRYARALPPAVSGQHGHDTTFRAAVRIARGFALDEEEAWVVLAAEWNPRCDPPWSDRDLRRKVREALRVGTMPVGELLARGRR